ncbi:MAG: thiamine-phosphate kinase [Thaumarchaeota archaeon]|nr:thiamine-phosphate kinase [Nitrososphaerota archaeon]
MPDELGVIRSIARAAGRLPKNYARIGDDVAVFPSRRGDVVFKTDMLVEHTDVPAGMTYRQAARKTVSMCVSDFAAKGVRPEAFMVSVGLRRDVGQSQVDGLAAGLRDASRKWEIHLVGGDTNEAEELVIDCAMIGFAQRVVRRRGASPGDVLVVSGPFGFPPAGLRILTAGAKASPGFSRKAVRSVLEPAPDLDVGLALAPFLTSSMDSSDGLARSIHTLARESGVGFELARLPMGDGVGTFAAANGLDPWPLVVEGGEEYVIVGTVRKADLDEASGAARKAGGRLIPIGSATERKGTVVLRERGVMRAVRDEGWTHLR